MCASSPGFFLMISFVQPYCEVSSQSHNCIVFCFAFLIITLYLSVCEVKVRRIAFGFGHFSSALFLFYIRKICQAQMVQVMKQTST